MKNRIFLLVTCLFLLGCGGNQESQHIRFKQLPIEGPGFYTITEPYKLYGEPDLIDGLQELAEKWEESEPSAPKIGINDISLESGGKLAPHSTHQTGKNVDLRPMRSDSKEEPIDATDRNYSHELTKKLMLNFLINYLDIEVILFNDKGIYSEGSMACEEAPVLGGLNHPLVKCWAKHSHHMHLSIN